MKYARKKTITRYAVNAQFFGVVLDYMVLPLYIVEHPNKLFDEKKPAFEQHHSMLTQPGWAWGKLRARWSGARCNHVRDSHSSVGRATVHSVHVTFNSVFDQNQRAFSYWKSWITRYFVFCIYQRFFSTSIYKDPLKGTFYICAALTLLQWT